MTPAPQGPRVFLSHASAEREVADELCAVLEANDLPCWIAPRDIPAGSTWAASIVEAVRTCDLFVLVHSRRANESDHVVREVGQAIGDGDPVFVVRVDDAPLSDALDYYLRSHQYVAIDATRRPPTAPELLVEALRAHLAGETWAAPAAPRRRSRTRLALMAGLLVPLALAIGFLGPWRGREPRVEPFPAWLERSRAWLAEPLGAPAAVRGQLERVHSTMIPGIRIEGDLEHVFDAMRLLTGNERLIRLSPSAAAFVGGREVFEFRTENNWSLNQILDALTRQVAPELRWGVTAEGIVVTMRSEDSPPSVWGEPEEHPHGVGDLNESAAALEGERVLGSAAEWEAALRTLVDPSLSAVEGTSGDRLLVSAAPTLHLQVESLLQGVRSIQASEVSRRVPLFPLDSDPLGGDVEASLLAWLEGIELTAPVPEDPILSDITRFLQQISARPFVLSPLLEDDEVQFSSPPDGIDDAFELLNAIGGGVTWEVLNGVVHLFPLARAEERVALLDARLLLGAGDHLLPPWLRLRRPLTAAQLGERLVARVFPEGTEWFVTQHGVLLVRARLADAVAASMQIEQLHERARDAEVGTGDSRDAAANARMAGWWVAIRMLFASRALEQGEAERALAEASFAVDYLRWAPAGLDWTGVEEPVIALHASAVQAVEEAPLPALDPSGREAFEQEQRERAARADRLAAEARGLLEAGKPLGAIEKAEAAQREQLTCEEARRVRRASYRSLFPAEG